MSKKAVLVLGPTASGKSKLSLKISLVSSLPIVNVDSVQIYKGLPIGSAQPSSEDLKLAPHSLYSYVDKGGSCTAAQYIFDVKSLLVSRQEQKDWIFCGGSGFYLQALEKGMTPAPEISQEVIQEIDGLVAAGWDGAYSVLIEKDPSMKRIHPNDHYRIRRGLEISFSKGSELDQLGEKIVSSPLEDYQILKIGLKADKERLRKRVTQRTQQMLEAGFIEEVEDLISAGYQEWAPLGSVGYQQVCDYLNGHLSDSQLQEKIVTANMQLIKKQMTWFKRDKEIQWYEIDELEAAVADVTKWLRH